MQQHSHGVWIALSVSLGVWDWYLPAWGQIVPDETLPVNSSVSFQDNTLQIDGGTAAGTNLFHSFQDFSVPNGSEVFFNNALTVENIITRVTGSDISNIDGLIRANGTANLFLLNPNGIVFGANARLELGGSFLGATADRLQFADGNAFSATETATTPPLLSVSVPIGLQFGATPGGIRVEGPGNNLLDGDGVDFTRDFRTVGLQVRPEHTLALVGGNIDVVGGNLTAVGDVSANGEKISSPIARGGRIELASVGGNSTVKLVEPAIEGLEGWFLNFDDVGEFQDIHLSRAASLDVSGSRVGTIQVRGRSISVREGSAMLALTLGSESALSGVPSISIDAEEEVEVSGETMLFDPRGPSVETKNGVSRSRTFTFESRLLTRAGRKLSSELSGRGGDITIETARLKVAGNNFIATETNRSGDAGNLTINATESVELSGGNLFATSLSPSRSDFNAGQGGNITIDTERLLVDDEAEISVSTLTNGHAGSLNITAGESIVLNNVSSIAATSIPQGSRADPTKLPTGNGGDIVLNTRDLRVLNGSNIATTTATQGRAGNLTVVARNIELIGDNKPLNDTATPRSSRLESQATSSALGDGGNITVRAENLLVRDGAQISVSTNGAGDSGNIDIQATDVELNGIGQTYLDSKGKNPRTNISGLFAEFCSGQLCNPDPENPSTVGNIKLSAANLQLRNGSTITAQVNRVPNTRTTTDISQINGGNIIIDVTNSIVAGENSDINANAPQGRGGEIMIDAQALFGSAVREERTPQSDITATGGVENGTIDIQTPDVDPSTGLLQLSQTPIDPTSLIGQNPCAQGVQSEFVNRGRGGLPPIPSEALRENPLSLDLLDFPPERESDAVDLTATPQVAVKPPVRTLVEAQGWWVDARGAVILTPDASTLTPQVRVEERSTCPTRY